MPTESPSEFLLAAGKTFPWHELYVPDIDAAKTFYTQALGFETEEYPMGDGFVYHMLKKNGSGVAGMMSTASGPAEGAPTHWAVYTAVDDVDQRVDKCVSMGAKVVVPAMDVPSVGRMCLISDPQGAHIWLFTPVPM